jgi:hypothetical protein
MAWSLSRFRAGDLVEVRSKDEILATLDSSGCLEGMPFMPEMLAYCGRSFQVRAVAHKTCDTIRNSGGRRLNNTVHLEDLRCTGCAHGGCQAECTLFWKDAWLKPVNGNGAGASPKSRSGVTEDQLAASTRVDEGSDPFEPRYVCQATKLLDATERLPWWDFRQYFFDVLTGNHSAGRVLGALWLYSLRRLLRRTPAGYRLIEGLYNATHRWLTGRETPYAEGKIKEGEKTPAGRLDLQPGELVRIKSKREIEETINESNYNRGLSFDKEMAPFCGSVVRVKSSVVQIIDETTGVMRRMKQPCIMLEGVVCKADYSECRLMCPRAIPAYWREIWLERVNGNGNGTHH